MMRFKAKKIAVRLRGRLLLKLSAAIFSAVILLCGCANKAVGETTETQELLSVMAELPYEEPQPYPVVINGTEISAKPERAVSLSPSLTEILCEMGYGGTIVGRGSYCDYPEEIAALTDAGRPAKPDYDVIISLEPDVLFTATAIPAKDMYRLADCGIKTVYLSYPHSVEEFERLYCAVGLIYEGLFEGEEKGKQCFSEIREVLGGDEISLGKFVYITEELSIATKDTFESSVLSCFGTNVGAEGEGYSFPKEYLLERQPDVVILNGKYTIDDLLADDIYSQLDAVKGGRVILADNSCFERPSARISELFDLLKSKIDEMG